MFVFAIIENSHGMFPSHILQRFFFDELLFGHGYFSLQIVFTESSSNTKTR